VRNGFYEQALELHTFACGLGSMHPGLGIIQNIVSEVEATAKGMHTQLLQLLQSDVQLAVCLRVVGYLRRLDGGSEQNLRKCFLECRDKWLQETLADLTDDNPSNYLVKLADEHRVHVFDIVTQYQSIFGNDTQLNIVADTTVAPTGSTGQAGSSSGGLLSTWVGAKVENFLGEVRRVLPEVTDSALLNNILKQCMYCGLSLSRVGVDFRVLLLPIFTDHLLKLFSTNLDELEGLFSGALTKHDWTTASASKEGSWQSEANQGGELMAPLELIDHAPLAAATNYLIMCFNDLRQCAPHALKLSLTQRLQACLESLTEHLIKTIQQMDQDLPQRPAAADSMLKVMAFMFFPYIGRCFDTVMATPGTMDLGSLATKLSNLATKPAAALGPPPPPMQPGAPPPVLARPLGAPPAFAAPPRGLPPPPPPPPPAPAPSV